MTAYDDGLVALTRLVDSEASSRTVRNEATTRLQLIDRLLFEVLGWERADCTAEERLEGKYADYALAAPYRAVIVEAKKEGIYFELPAGQITQSPRIAVRYFERQAPSVFEAIQQCIAYCQQRGTSVGVVSNGHQLVTFLASRSDGVPPLDGDALVFDSFDSMRNRFTLLWNVLSKPGVLSQGLSRTLSQTAPAPPPRKLSAFIPNYPGYRVRNQLQDKLQVIGDLIIEDVVRASANEVEFLRECYCPSGALSQYALVSKTILEARYSSLKSQEVGGPALTPVTTKKGIDPTLLEQSLTRRPILLVGDVGVGKTMFVRHLIHVDADDLMKDAIVLYVDLGVQPTLTTEVQAYVSSELKRQLRDDHGFDVEEDGFVRRVYHGELLRFSRGIYGRLKETSPEVYARQEIDFLGEKVANVDPHLQLSIEYIVKSHHRQVVVFLDNVDQRSDLLQQEVFLIGTGMAERWPVTVFVALRPETFYRSRLTGALSAYHPKAFTVAPPRLDAVIEKRLSYAISVAESGRLNSLGSVVFQVPTVVAYMRVLLESFKVRPELLMFCDNMCGGNIRLALDFIRVFIGSGHVDTQKILDKYIETGRYWVALHEFVRAVIYGDYQYFDPSKSVIVNVFDTQTPDRKEHFLTCLLLGQLDRLGKSQADGFVRIDALYTMAQDLGFTPAQTHDSLQRLLTRKLTERPLRSTSDDGSAHGIETDYVRISQVGAYYVHQLVRSFTYLDAMIVDTPITDENARAAIRDVVSIRDRADRAGLMLNYLNECWRDLGPTASLYFDWVRVERQVRREIDGIRAAVPWT